MEVRRGEGIPDNLSQVIPNQCPSGMKGTDLILCP